MAAPDPRNILVAVPEAVRYGITRFSNIREVGFADACTALLGYAGTKDLAISLPAPPTDPEVHIQNAEFTSEEWRHIGSLMAVQGYSRSQAIRLILSRRPDGQ